jgi:hypothetical protein
MLIKIQSLWKPTLCVGWVLPNFQAQINPRRDGLLDHGKWIAVWFKRVEDWRRPWNITCSKWCGHWGRRRTQLLTLLQLWWVWGCLPSDGVEMLKCGRWKNTTKHTEVPAQPRSYIKPVYLFNHQLIRTDIWRNNLTTVAKFRFVSLLLFPVSTSLIIK